MPALRQTNTNSGGTDSDGMVWGIPGRLLWLVLGALVLSGFLLLVTTFALHTSLVVAAFVSALPTALTVAYCRWKVSHPPGYDFELLQLWLQGRSFGPPPPTSLRR